LLAVLRLHVQRALFPLPFKIAAARQF
jgi:hypothetical protein